MISKPMLSGTLEDPKDAKFPALVTPKLDGIRCLKLGGKTVSRTFKLIPNRYIQAMMTIVPDDLDGELITFNADGSMRTFNQIQSDVMSEDGEPNFQYWTFDYFPDITVPYVKRMENLGKLALPPFCKKLLPWVVNNEEELLKFEEMVLGQRYEGVMLRGMNSPYKCGRSTLREGYLLKMKRFLDSEAIVIGFIEQMENQNEATEDELGHTKRSSHKDNMVPKNTLGKFLVRELGDTPWKGEEFGVGTGEGLTAELRKEIWDNRSRYLGKIITYKYQPHGIKNLPRLPIWRGFRDEKDL